MSVGGAAFPQLPLTLAGRELERYFEEASDGRLSLSFDVATPVGPDGTTEVSAFELHEALGRVLGPPEPTSGEVHIAVLYAGRYRHFLTAHGMMFDRGYATPDDPSPAPQHIAVPRQGCAVFLRAIADRRHDEDDRLAELKFVTAHELGHVFNLPHTDEPSFMKRSLADRPYRRADGAFRFAADHRSLLRNCRSRFVRPGGSIFGDHGDLHVVAPESSAPVDVAVLVDIEPRELHAFDPVELDISIETKADAAAIPDSIDPGYSDFVVWIEEPTGERRHYRPLVHHCPHDELRPLSPEEPLRRDISIFWGAEGLTFRRAGTHRIWCTHRRLPRSNVVEVEVRPRGRTTSDALLHTILCEPSTRKLLVYRSSLDGLDNAKALWEAAPDSTAAAACLFAAGRAARRLGSETPTTRDWLARASQHPRLSRHRRGVARQLLSTKGTRE